MDQTKKESERKDHDDYIEKKLKQLSERKRKAEARKGSMKKEMEPEEEKFRPGPLKVGEKVKVKDNGMVGEVTRVSNKAVTVAIGNITSKMPIDRLRESLPMNIKLPGRSL